MYPVPIIPKEQYMVIYRVAWLSLVSCMYALHRGHYSLAIVPGSVFLNSINYWRYPDYSWRRYLDIGNTGIMLIYQCYMGYNLRWAVPHYFIIFTAAGLYPIGVYYHSIGETWLSVYVHCILHILANAANIVLYSSKPLITNT